MYHSPGIEVTHSTKYPPRYKNVGTPLNDHETSKREGRRHRNSRSTPCRAISREEIADFQEHRKAQRILKKGNTP